MGFLVVGFVGCLQRGLREHMADKDCQSDMRMTKVITRANRSDPLHYSRTPSPAGTLVHVRPARLLDLRYRVSY